MRTHLLATTAVAATLLAATSSARAQLSNWNGTISTDWFNPNNWTPAGVPTAATFITNINTVSPDPTVVGPHTPGAEAGLTVGVGGLVAARACSRSITAGP